MEITCWLGALFDLLIISSSTLNCLSLNRFSSLQDFLPSTIQRVRWSHVPQSLVITPIVVVVHELRDRDFQIPWNTLWDLVDVKFNGPVKPLQLAVGLRMEGRSQDVADAHQPQVFSEGMRDIAWSVVRK